MKFTILVSGSKGNAYLLKADGIKPLLLECGIPIRQLKEKLNFNMTDIAGCLISHEHQDHSKAIKDLIKMGIDCYMSRGTAEILGVDGHYRVNILRAKCTRYIADWIILPFPLQHDAIEPVGFFIAYKKDRFLFIPDTSYVKNQFQDITMIAIECNYISDILSKNIQKGYLPQVVGHRVRKNHISLETLIKMLKANDLSKCNAIFLLHLSDGNADEAKMIKKVRETTGIPVYTT